MFENYKYRPDIIFGQFESYCAILLWTRECISNLSESDFKSLEFGDKNLSQLNKIELLNEVEKIKQNLFDTILLYGKSDISGGFYLFRNLLTKMYVYANNSEIYDEFLHTDLTPFANDLSSFSITFDNQLLPEISMIPEIHDSIIKTLDSCGYSITMEFSDKLKYFLELKFNDPALIAVEGFSQIQSIFNYWQSIWGKSLFSNIPLFSETLSAPVWKSDLSINSRYEILNILWNEIVWFPKPKNFKEALDMSQDERIVSLRNYIDKLSFKLSIGELDELSDIKFEIQKEVSHFIGKSWASQISRFSTYSSIPIGVSEMLLAGSGYFGLTLSSIGMLSQAASDKIEKNKSKHWISLGRDFMKRDI